MSQLDELQRQLNVLVQAMQEIRDVAQISEGVQFYAMLAEKALQEAGHE